MNIEQITYIAKQEMASKPCACGQRDKATDVDFVGTPELATSIWYESQIKFTCHGKCNVCQHQQKFALFLNKSILDD